MKHWRVIAISFLTLAPLALFAAIDQYENPLGCGLTTIPQFIKAVITIIVKIGIPIATIFIIWSGFLFLSAQGDEAKLTKAKKSFVWACIGTAVLLGAWLLATAINATIQGMSGATGGAGTTVNGGCGNGTNSSGTNLAEPSAVDQGALRQCTELLDLSSSAANQQKATWVTTPYNPSIVPANTHSSACAYDAGVRSIQSTLAQKPEDYFIYVEYKNGTSEWINATTQSTAGSVEFPKEVIQSYANSPLVSTVYGLHTHPYQGSANQNTQYSPPSLTDLVIASKFAQNSNSSVFTNKEISTNALWTYVVDDPAPMAEAMYDLNSAKTLFFRHSPQADASSLEQYDILSNKGSNILDAEGHSYWSQAQCATMLRALNGDFGTDEKINAETVSTSIAINPLFKYMTKSSATVGWGESAYQSNMGDALSSASKLGIILSFEQHPYAQCVK